MDKSLGKWEEPPRMRNKKIALIGCSAKKTTRRGRAVDVYLGNLFKWSLKFCKKQDFKHILILSAKHGVIELDDIIEPYNETLNTKKRKERIQWALKVERQLKEKGLKKYDRYYFCGYKYYEYLAKGQMPFAGFKGIGYILQWLKKQTAKRRLFDV